MSVRRRHSFHNSDFFQDFNSDPFFEGFSSFGHHDKLFSDVINSHNKMLQNHFKPLELKHASKDPGHGPEPGRDKERRKKMAIEHDDGNKSELKKWERSNQLLNNLPMEFGFGSMGDPFSMFDNFSKTLNKKIGSLDRNDPNVFYHSSADFFSYSNEKDDKPKMYQAHKSHTRAPGEVTQTRRGYRNSDTGMERMKLDQHIEGRGRYHDRSYNHITGDRVDKKDFEGMDAAQEDLFEKEWHKKIEPYRHANVYSPREIKNLPKAKARQEYTTPRAIKDYSGEAERHEYTPRTKNRPTEKARTDRPEPSYREIKYPPGYEDRKERGRYKDASDERPHARKNDRRY